MDDSYLCIVPHTLRACPSGHLSATINAIPARVTIDGLVRESEGRGHITLGYPEPLPQRDLEELFGRFAWKANGQSSITILGDWVERFITTVYIPELDGVPAFGGKFNGRVRWHVRGVEQLQRAFREIGQKGLTKHILLWGGSFVPRRMRGSSSLSRHSWGIAFDINPSENAFGKEPAAAGRPGSVRELVPVFEKHGFAWGGHWRESRRDGMHFEIARIPEYRTQEPESGARLFLDGRESGVPLMLKDGVSYASLRLLAAATGDLSPGEDRLIPVAQYLKARGFHVSWNAREKAVHAVRE